MKTCLKVGLWLVLAVLLAAGAALACGGSDCLFPGCDQDLTAWLPAPADGTLLACDSQPCNNRPGLDGPATPAAASQKKPQPGMMLACNGDPCPNRPGLDDERLAVQNLRRQLYVCIAETCGLTPDLASIMLTCIGPNCFTPVNPAEQTAVR